MKTYAVIVTRTEYQSAWVEVEANSEDEAAQLALELATDFRCEEADNEIASITEIEPRPNARGTVGVNK